MKKIKLSENVQEILLIVGFWIMLFLLFLFYTPTTNAQSVTRKGNVFVQDSSKSAKIKKDEPTLTKYYYMSSDGTKYPIYMSSTGKCFIIRTSKNGKQYKQYLPEITKQLKNEKRTLLVVIHKG